jgi:amino acid transporter
MSHISPEIDPPDGPSPSGGDASDAPVRSFSLRSAFALAFTNISPIVGIYSVFGIGLVVAGPAFWWAFPFVLFFQLLVTGAFGDLVSRWPFQGGVYAWSRELVGRRYGWITLWAYEWALTISVASVALYAATYLGPAVGLNSLSRTQTSLLALCIVAFITTANMLGSGFLRFLLYIALTAELVSSLGIGITMLFFYRVQPFSILFHTGGTGHGATWILVPFLAVVAFVGFSFLGQDGAGAIAEEVRESRRVLPKAMVLALFAVGCLVMFATLGLLLSIPDIGKVMTGQIANPIAATLETHLGAAMGRVLLAMLTTGYTSCGIALETGVSRAIWASARDDELPMSGFFRKLSGSDRLPRRVIAVVFVVAGAILFIPGNIGTLLVTAPVFGYFVAYAMPVVALAATRAMRRWKPGVVSMGRVAGIVTWTAAVWIVAETVNVAWPRNEYNGVWYLNWGIVIMAGVLGVIGWMIQAWVFRGRAQSRAPAAELIDAERVPGVTQE